MPYNARQCKAMQCIVLKRQERKNTICDSDRHSRLRGPFATASKPRCDCGILSSSAAAATALRKKCLTLHGKRKGMGVPPLQLLRS